LAVLQQLQILEDHPLRPYGGAQLWMLCIILALAAGWTDWQTRRIPNWLTAPAFLLGIAVNAYVGRWQGAKAALLGAALGLALLLPFVLLKALGGGDWKLIGALGAWLGPSRLVAVLILAIFAAGILAIVMVVWKKRVRRTLRNIGHMLASLFTLHLPGPELSLDNPESTKVPFGVAVALAVVFYVGMAGWRMVH
jgi:prepilin peptidase CpaA